MRGLLTVEAGVERVAAQLFDMIVVNEELILQLHALAAARVADVALHAQHHAQLDVAGLPAAAFTNAQHVGAAAGEGEAVRELVVTVRAVRLGHVERTTGEPSKLRPGARFAALCRNCASANP